MTSGTAAARERLEDFVTTFDNPEISAMAAICRILEQIPDETARLRVMRWSFGKFSEEFKRPLTAAAPVPPQPVALTARPTLVTAKAPLDGDFDRQVAELNDLFGDIPDGIRLAAPRGR